MNAEQKRSFLDSVQAGKTVPLNREQRRAVGQDTKRLERQARRQRARIENGLARYAA